ncbi:MAG: abortive infection protein, partial [Nitrososphaerales archaeon]
MRLKGVCYDVGAVMGFNWRPVFDPKIVHRELEVIKNDLHCNAVSISALDVGRVVTAATAALEEGLEVWLSPLLWDKSEDETVAYLAKAAGRLEALHRQWPDKVVLSVASESTLFMQGILEGKNIIQRLGNPKFRARIMAGEHNAPLNAFLGKAVAAVRKEFKGRLTYHSLIWEKVDW